MYDYLDVNRAHTPGQDHTIFSKVRHFHFEAEKFRVHFVALDLAARLNSFAQRSDYRCRVQFLSK